jgi:hypothetical protein
MLVTSHLTYANKRSSTLNEDVCTFIISRRILLGMRIFSDKICIDNKSTHFVSRNLFSLKIVPFMK